MDLAPRGDCSAAFRRDDAGARLRDARVRLDARPRCRALRRRRGAHGAKRARRRSADARARRSSHLVVARLRFHAQHRLDPRDAVRLERERGSPFVLARRSAAPAAPTLLGQRARWCSSCTTLRRRRSSPSTPTAIRCARRPREAGGPRRLSADDDPRTTRRSGARRRRPRPNTFRRRCYRRRRARGVLRGSRARLPERARRERRLGSDGLRERPRRRRVTARQVDLRQERERGALGVTLSRSARAAERVEALEERLLWAPHRVERERQRELSPTPLDGVSPSLPPRAGEARGPARRGDRPGGLGHSAACAPRPRSDLARPMARFIHSLSASCSASRMASTPARLSSVLSASGGVMGNGCCASVGGSIPPTTRSARGLIPTGSLRAAAAPTAPRARGRLRRTQATTRASSQARSPRGRARPRRGTKAVVAEAAPRAGAQPTAKGLTVHFLGRRMRRPSRRRRRHGRERGRRRKGLAVHFLGRSMRRPSRRRWRHGRERRRRAGSSRFRRVLVRAGGGRSIRWRQRDGGRRDARANRRWSNT